MLPTLQTPIDVIWPIANLLRGDFKRSEYGKVVLPFVVLRRLDWVLKPTRETVWSANKASGGKDEKVRDYLLRRAAGVPFYNISHFHFDNLDGDAKNLAANLNAYIAGFSANIREIFEYFGFADQIARLDKSHSDDLLLQVVQRFKKVDLHPDRVLNHEMGTVFEELIRRFSEQSNETAGEHFTPREVVSLMVNLLFAEDVALFDGETHGEGIVRTLYDPACGTGGMLSLAQSYLADTLKSKARLEIFGQELNPESYAVCKADVTIKGQKAERIHFGNSFSYDRLPSSTFDYMLCNPPFGVEWKKVEKTVRGEHGTLGFNGRFGPGLPRIDDGSLLFLMHMLSKRKRDATGTRLAIVFNASPLFSGGPTSGESKIRRWLIENDWLETIVALPDQLFYNTEIYSYIWIVTNRKSAARQGRIQLINATDLLFDMPKNKGKKRHEIGDGTEGKPDHIGEIVHAYRDFQNEEKGRSKIFPNAAFGYRRTTIERPLRLNFALTPDRAGRIENLNLSFDNNRFVYAAISYGWDNQNYDETIYPNQSEAGEKLDALLDAENARREAEGLKPMRLTPKQRTAILRVLGEKDPSAPPFLFDDGTAEADSALRDYENVPLLRADFSPETVQGYFEREVLPHVPDAFIKESDRDEKDGEIGKVGYEIPFNRHFYCYTQPRSLRDIEADFEVLETRVQELLAEVKQ